MQPFHAVLHALPEDARPDGQAAWHGRTFHPLSFERPCRTMFGLTFDAVYDRLSRLDRLYIEPDGSFLWTGPNLIWQVDGNLYDGGPALHHIDLKGTAGLDVYQALMTAFGWPETPLMFELASVGVYLDEAEFRAAFIEG